MRDPGGEGRRDARKHSAVQPGDSAAAGVEPRFQVLRRDGVIVAVMHVVVARPQDFHRRPDFAGQERRLHDEVGLRLAAEAPAEQRHVHADAIARDAEHLGERIAGPLRILGRGPHFAVTVGDDGERRRRLHGRVREVRHVVIGRHPPGRPTEGGIHVPFVADHLARPRRGRLELRAIRRRVVGAVRAVVPGDLELGASLNRRPGVPGHYGHAAEGEKA